AFCARSSASARSASKSLESKWACESISSKCGPKICLAAPGGIREILCPGQAGARNDLANCAGSLYSRADRHVFEKPGQHRRALRAGGAREDHAVRFDSAKLARLKIYNHDDLAPDELLGLVHQCNSGNDLPHFVADVHHELEQPICIRHFLRRLNLANAHFDLREILDADLGRGCGSRRASLR